MVKQFIIRNTNLHIIHYLTIHYAIYLIYFKKYLVLSKICVYFSVICNAMRTVHKFEITVNTKNLSDEKIKFPMQN